MIYTSVEMRLKEKQYFARKVTFSNDIASEKKSIVIYANNIKKVTYVYVSIWCEKSETRSRFIYM